MPTNVLIAGGGPAALEAALALNRLAGGRVATTVLTPESKLSYRPLSVLAPFAAGTMPVYPLERIAADANFTHVRGRLAAVDPVAHTVTTVEGRHLDYDVLVVATGARPIEPFPTAAAFTGSITDQERLHGIVQDVEGGYLRRLAFVVPAGSTWPLPLYELALMLGERADSMGVDPELHFITPEPSPLALFGADPSREVAAMLTEARVTLHTGAHAEFLGSGRIRLVPGERIVEVDRIVTLPRLVGPAIPGLPADHNGFLATDARARVQGVADVYAAGDITAFPVKQGGIACQQADAAAADIAARAGADVEPEPFKPVLRGLLLTERSAHTLAGDAPAKIAGRELATYLEGLDVLSSR